MTNGQLFNNISILESQQVAKLTTIAFIFIPITFVAVGHLALSYPFIFGTDATIIQDCIRDECQRSFWPWPLHWDILHLRDCGIDPHIWDNHRI
jgi:hypothetical protein